MDLQTRKLNFIQEFLKLESENAIVKFEKLLKKNNVATDFSSMSLDEFHNRILKSDVDSKNGKVTNVEDLLSEIKQWS